METFPGAGGAAVFKASSREVCVLPAGRGEAVLDSFWEGVGFFPEIGAGAVFTEVGLDVVVAFFEGETPTFAVEVGRRTFLVCF